MFRQPWIVSWRANASKKGPIGIGGIARTGIGARLSPLSEPPPVARYFIIISMVDFARLKIEISMSIGRLSSNNGCFSG